MESYFRAKRTLFLPEGGNEIEVAVINADDPWGERLSKEVRGRCLRYGFAPDAEVRAARAVLQAGGTELEIATSHETLPVRTHLLGRPNVYNCLAAFAAGLALGLDAHAILEGIASRQGVPGRMERVPCGQPFEVIVDYAHTPDALRNVLQTLSQLPHRRILTVFGCGGDRDRSKRPLMGEIAAQLSDLVIATSDNPRTEDPREILEQIHPGLCAGKAEHRSIVDRREAIQEALSRARKGDVVLIAGKGHETYQIIGREAHPFDDREVARSVLLARSPAAGGGP
jgi:UDP-N-acetylmuramoyl-L-alanyl-D-glutamate--2,6-diaminopimelate ligase